MASTPRYTDKFLNALMDPHHIYVLAELWYNNAKVGPFPLASGSVSADRNGDVLRTANLTVDPSMVDDPVLGPRLNPFGSIVKLWRGIRYPDNSVESYQIFTGRIDSVHRSIDGVTLDCSDLAANVIDFRFPLPYTVTDGDDINTAAATMIGLCFQKWTPPPDILFDTPTSVLVRSGQTFEQERGDALNQLMKTIGSEWFADPTGTFHLRAMPAVIPANAVPVWVVDSGDSGVIVTNSFNTDRQNVANFIVVDGEPVDGEVGANGIWFDTDTNSPTWSGGPYGVVTGYFSGQAVDTTYAAQQLAATLGANSIAKGDQVEVTCIPNPKIAPGDIVRVLSPRQKIDKMYFVQSFDMPLDPETAMTMTLYRTLTPSGTTREGMPTFGPSPLHIPEGSSWQPHP